MPDPVAPTPLAHSPALSAIPNFSIREVDFKREAAQPLAATAKPGIVPDPVLGPLSAFAGNWTGRGFNTIFRPDNSVTPTFPPPVGTDNVLELNLTSETLSFSKTLGSVPNRGSGQQGDIFLNSVPYLQTINDVTSLPANGIHFEPGMWLSVPKTSHPAEPHTLARMASIPHGTTIVAQGGVIATVAGKPTIASIDITPTAGGTTNKIVFPSQTATNQNTARLPQNLQPFITAGTITQAMLSDPNTVLRTQIQNQTITETVVIGISTAPSSPLPNGPLPSGALPPSFGGGPSNIAFLLGVASPVRSQAAPNAFAFQMDAVFWIETVMYEVDVPPLPEGAAPIVLPAVGPTDGSLRPTFLAAIPFVPGKSFPGGRVVVPTTQIQYSQKVVLNFNTLDWPHVSVATLVPADPIPIPASLLPLH